MNLDDATRKRIKEITDKNSITLTALCLKSGITPSTIFDFMYGKSKSPKIITIKRLCSGANITLKEFFSRDYFDTTDDLF